MLEQNGVGIEVEHVKTIKQKMSSTQSVILASTEQLQTPNQREIDLECKCVNAL